MSGDGRTAVRGGGGLYYDTDSPYNSSFVVSTFLPPFAPAITMLPPNVSFPTPAFSTAILRLGTIDYHIKQPKAWTYNVNLQREMGAGWAATVGYAGSRGYNLISTIEGNPVVPTRLSDGTLFFPPGAPRRNTAWGNIDYRTSDGRSEYNSLQASLMKRFRAGYQMQVSYTLSRAKDNNDAQLGADSQGSSTYAPNPYDQDAEWAAAIFDATHVFSANASWELPALRRQALLSGWQLNGIVSLRSGYPFSPSIATANWSRSGNTLTFAEDRPNVKPGTDPKKIVTGDPNRWFDPSAFELPPQGTFGNTPRNFLRGPGFANVDMSLVKNQTLTGDARLQLRFEVFNLFNRANFGLPTRTVFAGATQNEAPLATAGQILRTVNSSRQIQLGVKVLF